MNLGSRSSRGQHREEIGVPLGAATGAGHLDDALEKSGVILTTSAAVGDLGFGFLAGFFDQLLLLVHQELVVISSSEGGEGDAEGVSGAELDEEEVAAKRNF